MLSKVEDFFCNFVDSLPNKFEQLREYFQVADEYMLEKFKQQLTARATINNSD